MYRYPGIRIRNATLLDRAVLTSNLSKKEYQRRPVLYPPIRFLLAVPMIPMIPVPRKKGKTVLKPAIAGRSPPLTGRSGRGWSPPGSCTTATTSYPDFKGKASREDPLLNLAHAIQVTLYDYRYLEYGNKIISIKQTCSVTEPLQLTSRCFSRGQFWPITARVSFWKQESYFFSFCQCTVRYVITEF